MKPLIVFFLFSFLLTGCPGENLGVGSWRSIVVDSRQVCFSLDKADVLSRYVLSSTQAGDYKMLAATDFSNLSWPDTCIHIMLRPGYIYHASYTMNDKNYRYGFFIDNDWKVISTERGK